MEVGQNIEVKIDGIDLAEKRISLVPADYVSPENKDDEERAEYKNFIVEDKKKRTDRRGGQSRCPAEGKNSREEKSIRHCNPDGSTPITSGCAMTMMPIFSNKSRYLFIPLVFLAVFSLIALAYIKHDAELDRRHFQTHAAIIADDIWAVNDSGARAYLQLAVKADSYQSLSVTIPGNQKYLHVASGPLRGLNLVLHEMGLIGEKELSADIMHEDAGHRHTLWRAICPGHLPALQYPRLSSPVLLTAIFMIYLFINRRYLEQQVQERTQNLRESERRFHDLVDLLPEMVLETDLAAVSSMPTRRRKTVAPLFRRNRRRPFCRLHYR